MPTKSTAPETTTITVRLSVEARDRLAEDGAAMDRSVSYLARQIIEGHYAEIDAATATGLPTPY